MPPPASVPFHVRATIDRPNRKLEPPQRMQPKRNGRATLLEMVKLRLTGGDGRGDEGRGSPKEKLGEQGKHEKRRAVVPWFWNAPCSMNIRDGKRSSVPLPVEAL
ncbi:hypothetical protein HYQ44_010391 [Verticillium longisporum]|nr:hypothetical protein HYQ44_010391 [Verticillium longisporum]